ncbi:MAG TPA: 50S ribosomal protein L11 methyltransferase [Crocinitomicaceae bacterium]|nr:50S ribosomal protein L11 methyltransferase [Crocinitomicaceae bacterium]
MEYLALKVELKPVFPWGEILIAQLADYGFNGFEENENGISAYGTIGELRLKEAYTETLLNGENPEVQILFEEEIIPHQNWNEKWESEFQPVHVEDKLTILAPFHEKPLSGELQIIIQPKMSFGTGHHQTTWLMSKLLLDMQTLPDDILDMGTGTGILAFLAEKLGAKRILGIDIEPWSVESCIENAQFNLSKETTFLCGDIDLIEGKKFNMIIANINKNILTTQIPFYAKALEKGGILLLSGFFETDVDDLVAFAKEYNLKYEFHLTKENWSAIRLEKL